MNDKYVNRIVQYKLWSRKTRQVAPKLYLSEEVNILIHFALHIYFLISNAALTQYGMTRGINQFVKVGMEAVLNKILQLHDRNILDPY